jgi:CheY-like chemotaxis protein
MKHMAKVLIVEDDERTREAMSDFLLMAGHEVIEAVDGQQGLDSAKTNLPDVILLDFSLPIIHGWAVARELRSDARTLHIPIVALTAHVMVATEETAMEVGCNVYLTKPISLDRFEPWFREFLSEQGLS